MVLSPRLLDFRPHCLSGLSVLLDEIFCKSDVEIFAYAIVVWCIEFNSEMPFSELHDDLSWMIAVVWS